MAKAKEAQWRAPRRQAQAIWKAAQKVLWNAKNAFKQIVHEREEERKLENAEPEVTKAYTGNGWVKLGRDRSRPEANLGQPIQAPEAIKVMQSTRRIIRRKQPKPTIENILGVEVRQYRRESAVSFALERDIGWWLDLQAQQAQPPRDLAQEGGGCQMCEATV